MAGKKQMAARRQPGPSRESSSRRPGGRPPAEVSAINPPRQIGRWSDEDWAVMRAVADHYGLSMAELVRRFVFREAKSLGLK